MTEAEDLFRAGRLDEAIKVQNEIVRTKPLETDPRWWLFVLLSFAGDLERADAQLQFLSSREPSLLPALSVYAAALGAELERRRVFEGVAGPVLPPDAPDHLVHRVDAVAMLAGGDETGAAGQIARAIEGTPAVSGKVAGQPVDGLCDYDDLLGGVLEVYAGGRYLWLPFESIAVLKIDPPKTAIDVLWRTASLTDSGGTDAHVLLPSLYAATYAHPRQEVRIGHETEWNERGDLCQGAGQRLWVSSNGDEVNDLAFLEIHSLELGA